jgi:hypothetical protein
VLADAPCLRKARAAQLAPPRLHESASESAHEALGHRDFASVEVEAAPQPPPGSAATVARALGALVSGVTLVTLAAPVTLR